MEAIHTHVAGVDVHKDKLVITVLIGSSDSRPQATRLECATFTEDLRATGEELRRMGVTEVAMESTGVYWKPVFNVWHPLGLRITLANVAHVKNVPGRKTDVNDSHWLATLHRSGLIRPSFIPEAEFQELRLLTRHRANLTRDQTQVKNRIQKVLEDGNVKLGSVCTDIFGKGGMAVLRALASGEADPKRLAAAVKTCVRHNEGFTKALAHCLRPAHLFLLRSLVGQYDDLARRIQDITLELDDRFKKYTKLIERLISIPGIGVDTAEVILAEVTNHIDAFPDGRTFAAWAGVAPGNRESAGVRKRAGTRHGNPILKRTLVHAAVAGCRTKGTWLHAKHNQLRFRLGSHQKATVAMANRIARVVYEIIKTPGETFHDLGTARADPREHQVKRALNKLKSLGLDVEVRPKAAGS